MSTTRKTQVEMPRDVLKEAFSQFRKWEGLEEEVRSYGDEYSHTDECIQCTHDAGMAREDFCSAFHQVMDVIDPGPDEEAGDEAA